MPLPASVPRRRLARPPRPPWVVRRTAASVGNAGSARLPTRLPGPWKSSVCDGRWFLPVRPSHSRRPCRSWMLPSGPSCHSAAPVPVSRPVLPLAYARGDPLGDPLGEPPRRCRFGSSGRGGSTSSNREPLPFPPPPVPPAAPPRCTRSGPVARTVAGLPGSTWTRGRCPLSSCPSLSVFEPAKTGPVGLRPRRRPPGRPGTACTSRTPPGAPP